MTQKLQRHSEIVAIFNFHCVGKKSRRLSLVGIGYCYISRAVIGQFSRLYFSVWPAKFKTLFLLSKFLVKMILKLTYCIMFANLEN